MSDTGDVHSFAHPTARTRWPKILDQAIEEIRKAASNSANLSNNDIEAGKVIEGKIDHLKRAMAGDQLLNPLADDGGPDIIDYNDELTSFDSIRWLNAPWLYAECYLYRLLHTFFSTSTPYWQTFDMFKASKLQALVGSKKGTIELVKRFRSVVQALEHGDAVDKETQRTIFEEMVQISLWGNATDLSLLTSLSIEELDSRQGKAARESSKANVLIDDTPQVFSLLSQLKSSNASGEIHLVLDNAGFELLADLVFASYLIESGLTKRVTLHGKRMPWFVSDVNPSDLTDLIDRLAYGTLYPDLSAADSYELEGAGKHWRSLVSTGKLSFSAHPFWTTQHPYGRMAAVAANLYTQLANADVVIYKGDLNYRKLTYDCMWPKTTPFHTALGPLATKQLGAKGTRTLVLRTAKADVGVGLPEGLEEKLPGDWTRTGKYAMVSYWDAKS